MFTANILCRSRPGNLPLRCTANSNITSLQIHIYMSVGLNRQGMANLVIISVSTVFRQRQCPTSGVAYTSLSNDQRTIIIGQILQNTPNARERYVFGSLTSCDNKIQDIMFG